MIDEKKGRKGINTSPFKHSLAYLPCPDLVRAAFNVRTLRRNRVKRRKGMKKGKTKQGKARQGEAIKTKQGKAWLDS